MPAAPRSEIEKRTTTGYQTKAAAISSAAKAISHADFGFSAAELETAVRATITALSNDMAFTYSGVTVTAALGHVIAAKSTVVVTGNVNIKALQFIRLSADGSIVVTLEK